MRWMIMPLRRYADFSGRSRRLEYWSFILFIFLATFGTLFASVVLEGLVGSAAKRDSASDPIAAGLLAFLGLFWLALIIPWFAVLVRRLHDTDRSGLWLLIWLLPFGGLVILIFALMEGTRGPNSYGPDPKDEYSAEVFA